MTFLLGFSLATNAFLLLLLGAAILHSKEGKK
jgi:hypothetical protein